MGVKAAMERPSGPVDRSQNENESPFVHFILGPWMGPVEPRMGTLEPGMGPLRPKIIPCKLGLDPPKLVSCLLSLNVDSKAGVRSRGGADPTPTPTPGS